MVTNWTILTGFLTSGISFCWRSTCTQLGTKVEKVIAMVRSPKELLSIPALLRRDPKCNLHTKAGGDCLVVPWVYMNHLLIYGIWPSLKPSHIWIQKNYMFLSSSHGEMFKSFRAPKNFLVLKYYWNQTISIQIGWISKASPCQHSTHPPRWVWRTAMSTG